MTSILNEQRVIADALGVQPPVLPTIQHVANALHEFTQYVEVDPQKTALQLAQKYSEQHQFLYKFGAYCGYAMVFRSTAPELGAVFGPQIRRYGRLIGLPTETWEPLAIDSLASLGGSDPKQKILDLINGIDRTVREIR